MPLVCLGISHHSAPLDVRERHAVPAARLAEALVALCDYEAVREAVMVSTCNRMEIYAELADFEAGVAQLKQFVQNFRHGAVADINSYMYTCLGISAVEHLFRVTTGLDSMLIGEAEILGQVKSAYLSAQGAGTVGASLHRLFRAALQAGKTARSRTRIGAASLSVPTAALELARDRLGSLKGIRAMVIGAGKMGQLTARRLHEEGASQLLVANRTQQRAADVIQAIGAGSVASLDDLSETLASVDLVVTAAGASRFLITPEDVNRMYAAGRTKPLVILDIAVPRDVDPDVAGIAGVSLIDIDALRDVVEDHLERRRAAVPLVEALLAEQVERFAQWYRSRPALPAISALSRHADHIRAEELERLFARCPGLTEREKRLMIGASRRMLSRLLHPPFAQIRAQAAADLPAALELGQALTMLFSVVPKTKRLLPRIEGRIVPPIKVPQEQ